MLAILLAVWRPWLVGRRPLLLGLRFCSHFVLGRWTGHELHQRLLGSKQSRHGALTTLQSPRTKSEIGFDS